MVTDTTAAIGPVRRLNIQYSLASFCASAVSACHRWDISATRGQVEILVTRQPSGLRAEWCDARRRASRHIGGTSFLDEERAAAQPRSDEVDLLAGSDLSAMVLHRGALGLFKQHFLNFLPEPQGQGSLRPVFTLVEVGEMPDSSSRASKT